jgi:hypothetical protein
MKNQPKKGSNASIMVVDTATKLGPEHGGQVVISASHGGLYAAYLAARAGVRAVILNDAGVGKDQAGIAGLGYLDDIGLAAATISHDSARIGDGRDAAARGRISHVNETARRLGCATGQSAMDCARAMIAALPAFKDPPHYGESRYLLRADPDAPEVWAMDSISLLLPDDAGRILIAASHGGLVGGRADGFVKAGLLGLVLNDAGVGMDDAGISRLPALDKLGIPGATVRAATARIGDGRSCYQDGVISHVNATAARAKLEPGMTTRQLIERLLAHHTKRTV